MGACPVENFTETVFKKGDDYYGRIMEKG